MSVQINVHFQATDIVLLNYRSLCLEYRRLQLGARVDVESVQIVIMRIEAVVAARHTIRIYQWYNFEHILLE